MSIPKNDIEKDKLAHDYKLERYKFILAEQKRLNEHQNKVLAVFQTLCTAIVGGGVYVFYNWETLGIDSVIAANSIRGLYFLLVIVAIYAILSMIASMMSWFDYRKEEVELLDETVHENYRKQPTMSNLFRWTETYIILFIVISLLFIRYFMVNSILSSIH